MMRGGCGTPVRNRRRERVREIGEKDGDDPHHVAELQRRSWAMTARWSGGSTAATSSSGTAMHDGASTEHETEGKRAGGGPHHDAELRWQQEGEEER